MSEEKPLRIDERSMFRSPMARFIRPLHDGGYQHMEIPVILMCAYLVRLVIGLGSFSGHGKPPMHGDFEAQRHWLEITQHLPLSKWYFYDLQYWGLDYPPLTAYHSWVCGKFGSMLSPSWFDLDASRGNEAYGLVVFMRHTVIVSEFMTYVPAVLLFASLYRAAVSDWASKTLLILLQPSLVLIDHGHFQYNSVMLGLFVLSVYNILKGRLYIGAILYVMCLSFKQMGLYYSPAIFAVLLSLAIGNLRRFIVLSIITASTFANIYCPFLVEGGLDGLHQVVIRMFPFGRGLFEDKVANFWCALNVIYKLKATFDPALLQRMR